MIGFLLKTMIALIGVVAIITVIVALPWLFFVGVAFGCFHVLTNWS